jgi:hypothetical protein
MLSKLAALIVSGLYSTGTKGRQSITPVCSSGQNNKAVEGAAAHSVLLFTTSQIET